MPRSRHCSAAFLALAVVALSGCSGPEPRSFNDFLADRFARDGALARCNQDRDASLRDIECANARRAAAAVAVREERERREQLGRESERKLEEIRRLVALQQALEQEAAAAAAAAAEAVYELQWRESRPGEALPAADPAERPVDSAGGGETIAAVD